MKKQTRQRALLSEEAARIMIEEGVSDCALAKSKAANRLNIHHKTNLPDDEEVEAACALRLALFHPNAENIEQAKLNIAEEGMTMLGDFSPRLAGHLIHGPILKNTVIQIHVFADSLEEVYLLLDNEDISAELVEEVFYYKRGEPVNIPTLRLDIDSHPIAINVFPHRDIRKKPLSSGRQKTMERWSIDQLRTRRAVGQELECENQE